jgi:hypothetical protein
MSRTRHSRPAKREIVGPRPGAVRYDALGKVTCMAYADGYVMVRRSCGVPFVVVLSGWCALSVESENKVDVS